MYQNFTKVTDLDADMFRTNEDLLKEVCNGHFAILQVNNDIYNFKYLLKCDIFQIKDPLASYWILYKLLPDSPFKSAFYHK